MSKAKTKPTATSTPLAKTETDQESPESAVSEDEETFDASRATELILRLRSRHLATTDDEREAFASLLSDDEADKLGKKTRAVAVRSNGLRWAITIDETLRSYPGGVEGYSTERFAYYLGCLDTLHAELSLESERGEKRGSARDDAATQRADALKARSALCRGLLTCSKRDERKAVLVANGTADTVDNLSKALIALASLTEEWLARKDATSAVLAKSAGLSKTRAASARKIAKALVTKSTDADLEGNQRPRDTAPVNRAEGRFLFEMMEARRLFEDANAENALIPRLHPSASLRHVFNLPRTDDQPAPDDEGDHPPGDEKPS